MAIRYAWCINSIRFLQILQDEPTLNGLVAATKQVTGSDVISGTVKLFSALALITSFLGVALGLFECIDDLLSRAFKLKAGRITLGLLTFIPPLLFALFYPKGFILAFRVCRTDVCFLCSSVACGVSMESEKIVILIYLIEC